MIRAVLAWCLHLVDCRPCWAAWASGGEYLVVDGMCRPGAQLFDSWLDLAVEAGHADPRMYMAPVAAGRRPNPN